MKETKTLSVQFVAQAAVIAAIYVVLTLLFAPISYVEVQVLYLLTCFAIRADFWRRFRRSWPMP